MEWRRPSLDRSGAVPVRFAAQHRPPGPLRRRGIHAHRTAGRPPRGRGSRRCLRQRVENTPIPFKGQDIRVTVSIGVAVVEKDVPAELDQMRDVCEAALAEAKQQGRNRCVVITVPAGAALARRARVKLAGPPLGKGRTTTSLFRRRQRFQNLGWSSLCSSSAPAPKGRRCSLNLSRSLRVTVRRAEKGDQPSSA